MAGRDLVRRDHVAVDHRLLERQEPLLVIGAGEIDRGREALAREALRVDVHAAVRAHGAHHGHYAAFPFVMERRLVLFDLDSAEAVHATHVMYAIHFVFSSGAFGTPVPIMESRVTISASCSSLQPSVPAGRIGRTRKRVSAVESQTRMSVSFGSVTPKSARTPRGSFTARER